MHFRRIVTLTASFHAFSHFAPIEHNANIKLCPTGASTCALPLFCDRDLEINAMTLKVEDDLYNLKMYLHTENKAASLSHSKLRA